MTKGYRKFETKLPIELCEEVKDIATDQNMPQNKAYENLLILGIKTHRALIERNVKAEPGALTRDNTKFI